MEDMEKEISQDQDQDQDQDSSSPPPPTVPSSINTRKRKMKPDAFKKKTKKKNSLTTNNTQGRFTQMQILLALEATSPSVKPNSKKPPSLNHLPSIHSTPPAETTHHMDSSAHLSEAHPPHPLPTTSPTHLPTPCSTSSQMLDICASFPHHNDKDNDKDADNEKQNEKDNEKEEEHHNDNEADNAADNDNVKVKKKAKAKEKANQKVKTPPPLVKDKENDNEKEKVAVLGYNVNPKLASTALIILNKYGDVLAGTSFVGSMLTHLLESVCIIYQKLKTSKFQDLTLPDLESLRADVSDFQKTNMEVSWLLQRLDEIIDAKKMQQSTALLNDTMFQSQTHIAELDNELKIHEDKMEQIQSEIQVIKEKLTTKKAESEVIYQRITEAKEKVERFSKKSLVDGI